MHWIPCVVGLAVVLLVGPGLAAAPATDTSDVAPTDSGAVNGYRYAKQRPVGFERVTIGPGFIQRVRDRSREVGTLDYLQKFEQAHYIDFFRWVNTDPPRRHGAGSNNDEFVHKLLEAMGVYAAESDLIARQHKELSDTILAAQAEDGYLNTYYDNPIVHSEGKRRFQSENRFEFYNFGHYAQAAIAHYRATGDRRLLDSAIGFADLIVERFANPNDLPYRKWKDRVNLKYEHPNPEPGRYYTLHRVWNDGDTIQLDLAMTPRIIQPNRKVDAQQGRLAMMLGPMVYCVEAPDNPGVALRHLSVSNEVAPAVTLEKDLLGGVNVLTFSGWEWTADRTSREVTVRAIPYYTRANRKIGYMNVWLATDEQLAIAPPQPGPSPKPVAPVPITKPR